MKDPASQIELEKTETKKLIVDSVKSKKEKAVDDQQKRT